MPIDTRARIFASLLHHDAVRFASRPIPLTPSQRSAVRARLNELVSQLLASIEQNPTSAHHVIAAATASDIGPLLDILLQAHAEGTFRFTDVDPPGVSARTTATRDRIWDIVAEPIARLITAGVDYQVVVNVPPRRNDPARSERLSFAAGELPSQGWTALGDNLFLLREKL